MDALFQPPCSTAVGAPDLAALEGVLAGLHEDRARATHHGAELASDRSRVLLGGSDDELVEHDRRIAKVGRDLQRLDAQIEQREAEVAAARQSYENARRLAAYEQAIETSAEAQGVVRRLYAKAVENVRAVVQLLAEARSVVEAVNGDLPAGMTPLPDPEMALRGRAPEPAREIRRDRVDLFVNGWNREPFPPDTQAKIRVAQDGTGSLPSNMAGSLSGLHQVPFWRVELLPARSGEWPERLAQTVNLPGLCVGDAAGWSPLESDCFDTIMRAAQDARWLVPATDPRPEVKFERVTLDDMRAAAAASAPGEVA